MKSRIRLPYFDGAEVEGHEDDLPPGGADALARFLRLGPEDRTRDARHVLAYWTDFRELVLSVGDDWEIAEPPVVAEDVWRHVQPLCLVLDTWKGAPVVAIEANCDWEEEHGLTMVWLDGERLIRVGPFDGHPNNLIWKRGPAFEGVVYEAHDPRHTTWRDG